MFNLVAGLAIICTVAHFSTPLILKTLYMKQFFTLLLPFVVLTLSAFAPARNLDGVIAALNSGNAASVARYVDDKVEINVPGKKGSYNSAQATAVLKDFFAANSVRSFKVLHKGDKGGKQFCIGVLQTQSGNFRTQILMENKGGREYIKLLSLQAE